MTVGFQKVKSTYNCHSVACITSEIVKILHSFCERQYQVDSIQSTQSILCRKIQRSKALSRPRKSKYGVGVHGAWPYRFLSGRFLTIFSPLGCSLGSLSTLAVRDPKGSNYRGR